MLYWLACFHAWPSNDSHNSSASAAPQLRHRYRLCGTGGTLNKGAKARLGGTRGRRRNHERGNHFTHSACAHVCVRVCVYRHAVCRWSLFAAGDHRPSPVSWWECQTCPAGLPLLHSEQETSRKYSCRSQHPQPPFFFSLNNQTWKKKNIWLLCHRWPNCCILLIIRKVCFLFAPENISIFFFWVKFFLQQFLLFFFLASMWHNIGSSKLTRLIDLAI